MGIKETSLSPPAAVPSAPAIEHRSPPTVTSSGWAVADGLTGQLLFGGHARDRREIASLTKIMTLYTSVRLVKRFALDPAAIRVTVSRDAAWINGTRAELREGDVFRLDDLLYAMILPSGNDAAMCLSEYFGGLLQREALKLPTDAILPGPLLVARKHFVHEMNANARLVGMAHTKFDNPTGLGDRFNKSTAEDVGKLCAAAMKVPEFRAVVSCKEHRCTAQTKNGAEKQCGWTNTNKMLWKGYDGVKTGVTPNAGPCLATSVERMGRSFVIVLLQAASMEARWEETEALLGWSLQELGLAGDDAAAKLSGGC